jgi:hypothetical protein
MAHPSHSPGNQVVMPEALRLQLDGFRRQLWRVKIMEAVAAGVIGILISFLLVYGLDRVWQTPSWVRLGLLIGGFSLFAVFVPFWLHRWVWRQRREAQLAKLISRRYPGLGDRLLGVIELQNQQGSADTLSPRLREAAMEAVAAETSRRRLDEALPPQKHRTWALAALGLVGISVVAFVLTPRAGFNALQRWLMPLSDTQRYTFTRLEQPPEHLAVAFGEAFEVVLRLAADSEQEPRVASTRYGLQEELGAELNKGTYRFVFPGQQEEGRVVFEVGDLRHELRVEPVQRPGVVSVVATVRPPEYLQIPEKTAEVSSGVITAVAGSQVKIELTATRALAKASFGPTRNQAVKEPSTESAVPAPLAGEMEISGSEMRTPSLAVAAVPFEIPFDWEDRLGLAGAAGFSIRLDAMEDAAPTCYLQGIDRQKVMLPEETVEFEVLAEDDFGVRQLGIEWTGELMRATDAAPAKGDLKLVEGGSEDRRLFSPASFSPAAFGIGPQKITLRGYSQDFLPLRGRVYSEPVTLYVLTRDEHAQMLKNKFDRSITEFEDLARREMDLFDENQRLERLSGENLQNEESAKRLESQELAEAETQRRMDELTERMESLMKDAARNGDIEKETLRKMAESLKSMQELAESDVPKVREKLGDSRQRSNTPEKAKKDVGDAVEEQRKVVEKMQEAIEKANEANRQFEAGTFVNRLKKAAGEQNGIASALIEGYERILGIKSAKLDPSDQRRMLNATRQQATTASDIRWLQEDLSHYAARTKSEAFSALLAEMKSSEIDIGLEQIRSQLAANHSFLATENSKKWADLLSEWAGGLDGEKDQGDSGGGGGGGAQSPEDEDFEFMLRVMKLIQQEQDLRAQTRVLEQIRRAASPANPSPPEP